MRSNHSNRSRASPARGFTALCAMLAMGLGLTARPAAAAPFAYVTNEDGTVTVIDTNPPSVVATIEVGNSPRGVAVTPDGKQAYVANSGFSNSVSVIDTASNTVVATVAVAAAPQPVAVTSDGKHVYVGSGVGVVSVIDTANNTVVATVPVGAAAIAITPDGKHAYVVNHDAFALGFSFTLSSTDSNGIDPLTEAVTLQVGTFTATIPPGSFKKDGQGSFAFVGVINGVGLGVLIKPTGTLRYLLEAKGIGANLAGTKNTVYVTLAIGGDSGATSVNASISP